MALVNSTDIYTHYGSVPFISFLISARGMAFSPVNPKTKSWRALKPVLMRFCIANSTNCTPTELRLLLSDKNGGRIAHLPDEEFYRALHISKATEARDKAYSCLWAFNEVVSNDVFTEFPLFQVDYTKPLSVIYTEFTVAIIKLKNVDVPIHYAYQRGKSDVFPSWVPDWSQEEGFDEVDDFYTSFGAKGNFAAAGLENFSRNCHFQDQSMFVLAHTTTVISACVAVSGSEEIPIRPEEWKKLYRTVGTLLSIFIQFSNEGLGDLGTLFGPDYGDRKWNQVVTKAEQSIVDESGIDVTVLRLQVLQDLLARYDESNVDKEIVDLNFVSFSRSVHDILRPFYQGKEIESMSGSINFEKFDSEATIYLLGLACENGINFVSIFHEVIFGRFAGRIVFCAENGMSGFALAAQPGDEIALWKGMNCPVIVRKVEDEKTGEEYWKMVSIAYVEGMMKGEEYNEKKLMKLEIR
jgi:hypothetical protein